nr:Chain B, ADENOVIRAL PROTEINASE [Human adenovirus 2]1NLN_B Chain B, PVIC [synthetic construct]4PID_B Chain B, Pre-protein VI [Human adenovirus 2]4PIE_B Chain B, Pre-protein VI [Human adenovirus 2]5FGY_B Chain B, pVIC [Homo sapiens]
GVQSLKRRRCF